MKGKNALLEVSSILIKQYLFNAYHARDWRETKKVMVFPIKLPFHLMSDRVNTYII